MSNKPPSIHGLATIMRLAFAGNDLRELAQELLARLARDPHDAAALLDLAIVHQLNGRQASGLELQWQALQLRQHFRLGSNPFRPGLRVLAIMGPGAVMDNTPIEFLIERSDIALEFLYVGTGLPPVHDIPPHDLAFVAVCESDTNQHLLRQLQSVMRYWPHPHINSPNCIAALARDGLSELLQDIAGVEVVRSQRFGRQELEQHVRLPVGFPAIVRPANSHAGQGLHKLDAASQIPEYLAEQPDSEFSLAPFVDYRSVADGLFRKYRVTMIAGHAYPAHMAISPRWMVHYLNADMQNNPVNRAAEKHFMEHFDLEFGARHQAALASIDARLHLDYYSIDCGEMPDGRLLIFEIDSGAVVHAMDPIEVFPYKQAHMQKIFSAFHGLLKRAALKRSSQAWEPRSVRTAA